MPIVVHITDEKNIASIIRSGVRPSARRSVVYFMPVVAGHMISHQWLRELKRSGARNMVGVYLRIPSTELVWAGHYNRAHAHIPLGEAIRSFTALPDPLGFELFTDRKLRAAEVQKVRALPQTLGWRYYPNAHGKTVCGCPGCIRGGIKSRALREAYDAGTKRFTLAAILATLARPAQRFDVLESLEQLRTKRRYMAPTFLEQYLDSDDLDILTVTADTLPYFRHPESRAMLITLCDHPNPSVKKTAQEALRAYDNGRKQ
jgi:hypothetical protein